MQLDEAVAQVTAQIARISSGAAIQVKNISDEESRISVYAAADQIEPIREATRDLIIQLMTAEGLDVQVFVYDLAVNKPPAS
jgi:uncharacterized protein (DUF849 family)